MYVIRYKMPTTLLKWTEHTYAENIEVRNGIAFVQTEPAKDFLLCSGFEMVPNEEIEIAQKLFNS